MSQDGGHKKGWGPNSESSVGTSVAMENEASTEAGSRRWAEREAPKGASAATPAAVASAGAAGTLDIGAPGDASGDRRPPRDLLKLAGGDVAEMTAGVCAVMDSWP